MDATPAPTPYSWKYTMREKVNRTIRQGSILLRHGSESLPVHIDPLVDASRLVARLLDVDPDLTEIVVPDTISSASLDAFLGMCVYASSTGYSMLDVIFSTRAATFFECPSHITNFIDEEMCTRRYMRDFKRNGVLQHPAQGSIEVMNALLTHHTEMSIHLPKSWSACQKYRFIDSENPCRRHDVLLEMHAMSLVEGQTYGMPPDEESSDAQKPFVTCDRRLLSETRAKHLRALLHKATDGRMYDLDALGAEIAKISVLTPTADTISLTWKGEVLCSRTGRVLARPIFPNSIAKPVALYMKTLFGIDADAVHSTPDQITEWRGRYGALFLKISLPLDELVRLSDHMGSQQNE